jgi:hypothetical protein
LKGRDLALLAVIVLVAGFAAADALRNRSSSEESPTPPTTVSPDEDNPRLQPDAPPGWPVGTIRGTLVFTDARDCRIRVIGLAGGRERPLRRIAGDCRLWVAPRGPRIAFGIEDEGFGVASLSSAFDAGTIPGDIARVEWRPDGQRFAWCDTERSGFEAELGESLRRLDYCPAAYTPEGQLSYAVGRRLVVGKRTVLRASGEITYARWGTDGSVAITVRHRRFERWEGSRMTGSLDIPGRYGGDDPFPSPDNCAAIFRDVDGSALEILTLDCFPRRSTDNPLIFGGTTATWSPDGRWIAVAEGQNSAQITFAEVVGQERALRWPAGAVDLFWRGT